MLARLLEKKEASLGFAGALILLVVLPPFLSRYVVDLLTQTLVWAILAVSLDIQLGYTGLPSLGHAAYMGVGAYTTAILLVRYQATFPEALLLSLIIAAITAAIFGLFALRAAGHYYLMITLALAMVIWGLAYRWTSMTDGDNGIAGVPRPDLGLPLSLDNVTYFYYFSFIVFLIAFILMFLIVKSPFGQTLVGIRESESRMRTLGYNVWLHKYIAFIITGTFGGLSGVLWALYNSFVSPVEIELLSSLEALLMVALGGPATLFGAVIGSGIIVFLKNLVSVYIQRWMMIMGGIYVLTVLYAPDGLLGLARRALKGGGKR